MYIVPSNNDEEVFLMKNETDGGTRITNLETIILMMGVPQPTGLGFFRIIDCAYYNDIDVPEMRLYLAKHHETGAYKLYLVEMEGDLTPLLRSFRNYVREEEFSLVTSTRLFKTAFANSLTLGTVQNLEKGYLLNTLQRMQEDTDEMYTPVFEAFIEKVSAIPVGNGDKAYPEEEDV